MDYDPIVPQETSSSSKVVMYAFLGGISIFIIATAIIAIISGSKYGHSGNYIAVVGLLLIAVSSYLLYSWIPHDAVEDKVKNIIVGQGAIIIIITLGVLLMTYNTTPCPECPKPIDVCKKAMIDLPVENWRNAPVCFDDPLKKNFFICISKEKKCNPADWVEYDHSEQYGF